MEGIDLGDGVRRHETESCGVVVWCNRRPTRSLLPPADCPGIVLKNPVSGTLRGAGIPDSRTLSIGPRRHHDWGARPAVSATAGTNFGWCSARTGGRVPPLSSRHSSPMDHLGLFPEARHGNLGVVASVASAPRLETSPQLASGGRFGADEISFLAPDLPERVHRDAVDRDVGVGMNGVRHVLIHDWDVGDVVVCPVLDLLDRHVAAFCTFVVATLKFANWATAKLFGAPDSNHPKREWR